MTGKGVANFVGKNKGQRVLQGRDIFPALGVVQPLQQAWTWNANDTSVPGSTLSMWEAKGP